MKKYEFDNGDWACVVLYAGEPKYTNRYKLNFTGDYDLSDILNYARKLGEEEGFVPKFIPNYEIGLGGIVIGDPNNEKNQFVVALEHDIGDMPDEEEERANKWLDDNTRVFESHRRPGRMLKEEDERVSLDVSCSDEWDERGKKYMDLDVKKNGKYSPVKVCVVFTDEGEHLNTVFYTMENAHDNLTEEEVAEELDVSVGDVKKLVEKAKIEAMKCFE